MLGPHGELVELGFELDRFVAYFVQHGQLVALDRAELLLRRLQLATDGADALLEFLDLLFLADDLADQRRDRGLTQLEGARAAACSNPSHFESEAD